ncbi:MAG: pyridoxamine 5'-phosphate oxidase [Geminicoccaceae bacterium]|nr:pyridoxamine 5'-phosphate oxidase [Geminicoccaceae bacterium]
MRQNYDRFELNEQDVAANPLDQFARWFEEARSADLMEPNAMSLATATAEGAVANRMVLLKGFDAEGFTFFTNYESKKAQDLALNGRAALLFWWDKLHRQVRIEGPVSKVGEAESDAYFATRPHGSRIGALASPQSRVIEGREKLAERFTELEKKFPQDVPRPAHWGGYRVRPLRIEFWQGRPSRLHDRLVYRRDDPEAQTWHIERLAP